jgi:5S rRNA maturation endonuclease (ribonuclease M5)
MHTPQSIDNLIDELDNLKKYKQKVIVEGEHDKAALNELGIENIFVLHRTGTSVFTRIEELMANLEKKESCVILTDLDKKGKTYYKLLKKELVQEGFKVNNRMREILTRFKVSHIEGLSNFVKRKKFDNEF